LKRLDRLYIQAVRAQTIKEFPIADTRISLRRRMEIYGHQGERLDVIIDSLVGSITNSSAALALVIPI